jgi:hypothetical protein
MRPLMFFQLIEVSQNHGLRHRQMHCSKTAGVRYEPPQQTRLMALLPTRWVSESGRIRSLDLCSLSVSRSTFICGPSTRRS